jgi:hypothetical protein
MGSGKRCRGHLGRVLKQLAGWKPATRNMDSRLRGNDRKRMYKDGVVDSQDFAEFAENWLQSSIVED